VNLPPIKPSDDLCQKIPILILIGTSTKNGRRLFEDLHFERRDDVKLIFATPTGLEKRVYPRIVQLEMLLSDIIGNDNKLGAQTIKSIELLVDNLAENGLAWGDAQLHNIGFKALNLVGNVWEGQSAICVDRKHLRLHKPYCKFPPKYSLGNKWFIAGCTWFTAVQELNRLIPRLIAANSPLAGLYIQYKGIAMNLMERYKSNLMRLLNVQQLRYGDRLSLSQFVTDMDLRVVYADQDADRLDGAEGENDLWCA
jgi:hypothetical protein